MGVNRSTVRLLLYIFGPLVLVSYVYGVSKMLDPNALWGGIPESWRPLNVTCMFVAAAGFLIMWWFFLYRWDAAAVETIQWPWAEGTEGGHGRILLGFLMVVIPSMFWLEATSFHIRTDYSWTMWLTIGILVLASIGNILLGLLAWDAYQNDIASGAIWPVVGAVMLSIQIIINDAILWSIKFPWN